LSGGNYASDELQALQCQESTPGSKVCKIERSLLPCSEVSQGLPRQTDVSARVEQFESHSTLRLLLKDRPHNEEPLPEDDPASVAGLQDKEGSRAHKDRLCQEEEKQELPSEHAANADRN